MRLSLIVLALVGLAGCSINSPPPAVSPAAVVAPPTTTYVTPAPSPAPGTTVITH